MIWWFYMIQWFDGFIEFNDVKNLLSGFVCFHFINCMKLITCTMVKQIAWKLELLFQERQIWFDINGKCLTRNPVKSYPTGISLLIFILCLICVKILMDFIKCVIKKPLYMWYIPVIILYVLLSSKFLFFYGFCSKKIPLYHLSNIICYAQAAWNEYAFWESFAIKVF